MRWVTSLPPYRESNPCYGLERRQVGPHCRSWRGSEETLPLQIVVQEASDTDWDTPDMRTHSWSQRPVFQSSKILRQDNYLFDNYLAGKQNKYNLIRKNSILFWPECRWKFLGTFFKLTFQEFRQMFSRQRNFVFQALWEQFVKAGKLFQVVFHWFLTPATRSTS